MKSFTCYHAAATEARTLATAMRCDVGIERNHKIGRSQHFTIRLLPRPENRYGYELRCEVIAPDEPQSLSTCPCSECVTLRSFTLQHQIDRSITTLPHTADNHNGDTIMSTEFTKHLDRATCLAILAEAPDHVLRGGVAALLASPVTPVAAVVPKVAAAKVNGAAVAKAAPAKAAAAVVPGNTDHAAAVAALAPEGFAAGELAALLSLESRSSAIKTAIQNALKAKTLFAAGEKRYTRYGATAAIAKAAVAAAKAPKAATA